jgi:glycerophosphoryl diester phosphodiesterase
LALFLAHRGASHLAPENTLTAFALARNLEADGFECDIQQLKSGELVLYHDRDLKRTVRVMGENQSLIQKLRQGGISQLTWDEVCQLEVGSWKDERFRGEKIPLLEDLLKFVSESDREFLMIEIKLFQLRSLGLEKALIDLLKKYPLKDRLLVASFNAFVVWRLKKLKPDFPLGFISEFSPAWYRNRHFWLPILKPDVFLLEFSDAMVPEMIAAKNKGMKVFSWTLDSIEEMQKAIDAGTDCVITNRPEVRLQMTKDLAQRFEEKVIISEP